MWLIAIITASMAIGTQKDTLAESPYVSRSPYIMELAPKMTSKPPYSEAVEARFAARSIANSPRGREASSSSSSQHGRVLKVPATRACTAGTENHRRGGDTPLIARSLGFLWRSVRWPPHDIISSPSPAIKVWLAPRRPHHPTLAAASSSSPSHCRRLLLPSRRQCRRASPQGTGLTFSTLRICRRRLRTPAVPPLHLPRPPEHPPRAAAHVSLVAPVVGGAVDLSPRAPSSPSPTLSPSTVPLPSHPPTIRTMPVDRLLV